MSRWRPSATSTASAAQVVAERAGASAFTRWEEMLAAGGLDALFVCTPPMHHAAPAIAALERGLAVYLEKPLARSLADGEAIVAAWQAERNGLRGGLSVALAGRRGAAAHAAARDAAGPARQPQLRADRRRAPRPRAGSGVVCRPGHQRRPAVRAREPRHRSPDRAGRSGGVGAGDRRERPARTRRPPAEPAWTTPSRCSCASPPAASAPATSPGAPSSPRRSTRSTSRRRTLRSSSYSIRSSSCAAAPAAQRSRCAAASTLASRRSPLPGRRAPSDPARCPAPPPMRSPPCAPCWPASRQSRAASACGLELARGLSSGPRSGLARQAGPDPTGGPATAGPDHWRA